MHTSLRLDIRLDGAAFDGFADHEVALILRTAAAKIESGALGSGALSVGYAIPLTDSNGNAVGKAEVFER